MVQRLGLGTFTVVVWVQFLVGKLIPHKLCSTAKDKAKTQNTNTNRSQGAGSTTNKMH